MVNKMKVVLAFLAAFCLVYADHTETHTADKLYLTKQKNITELFLHVDQPTVYHPELYYQSRTFNIEDHISFYTDRTAVTEFLQRWKHGMLPRGQVFSVMYPQLHEEATCLFRLLYSAKNFNIFYDTAVWARFNVNEQMYIYALSVAVLHREDCRYIRIPPLYEVVPNFFFNEDVLHQAYRIIMGDVSRKKTVDGVDYYTIHANYSDQYLVRNNVPDQKLSYFTEDVGLGQFYFMMQHDFPYWMNSSQYELPQNIRGEMYYYIHKQMLVRYYLERLSNEMGEIDYVDFYKPITVGYYPTMHHHNAVPFPHRETGVTVPLHMHKYVEQAENIQTRISNAIDSGYIEDTVGHRVNIYTPEGFNVLGNIIQGNADSPNYKYYGRYDTLCRKIFGFSLEPATKYQIAPSALEIFSTSTRDPVFFSVYKNIVAQFMKYKENMPYYTQEEIDFPDVTVESVTVDKLMTFFDHFESTLNNALTVRSHQQGQSIVIRARQYRLNHKPFTYHINVYSGKVTKAIVRVFLGPKFDVHGHELDISENYMNFLELDQWLVDLTVGTNKIERNSHESVYAIPDDVPIDVFYNKIVKALDDSETFTYSTKPYGFPDRLMLPKGKKEGMPFVLCVHVAPVDETIFVNSPVLGRSVMDGRPMGFPLDRPVQAHNFHVHNLYFKDVMIYHKQLEELNVTV